MAFLMLVAGIGLVVAGLLAIGFGIPIKEFSTGNTLIMAGVIGVCTGAIMLGLWVTVRELRNIARRLANGLPEAREEAVERPAPPVAAGRESTPRSAVSRQPTRSAVPEPLRRRRPSHQRRRRRGRTRRCCAIIRFRSRCIPPSRHRRLQSRSAI